MAYKLNIKSWGPKDRNGQIIKRADTVIVYKPDGSTDTIWLTAHVSNVQTDVDRVCVLCGDGDYHYFAPEDLYVIMRSSYTSINELPAPRTKSKSKNPKQWENYRLPRRRDNVYHPGLGEVVYVDKRVKDDVVLRRFNDRGNLTLYYVDAKVYDVYPVQRCYYKDGRWRPLK